MPEAQTDSRADIEEIVADFEILDDASDRIEYLIELGRKLVPLPAEAHDETEPRPRLHRRRSGSRPWSRRGRTARC